MGVIEACRWADPGDGLWRLLDDAVGAFALLDADGLIVEWNRAAEATFGWARPEAVGADAVELLIAPPRGSDFGQAVHALAASDGAASGHRRIELLGMHRDGHEVPFEVALSRVDVGARTLVAAFMRDVSERKEALAQQKRMEEVLASSGEAIVSGSLNGLIESWNP